MKSFIDMISAEHLRAGAQFYQRYYDDMIRQALRYVPVTYDAEDVVSECWAALLPDMERLTGMSETARIAHILTAVKQAAREFARTMNQRRHPPEEIQEIRFGSEWLNSAEYQDLLPILIEQLPPHEAEIIRCKRMKRSVKLSMTPDGMRFYWLRARRHLRGYLQALGAWKQ